ncbi:MAG: hypothetical protein AAF125_14750, partial [Chloroflexota bacterium]
GRTNAYNHINQHLADPTTSTAAVFVGRRFVGKSALLWHFREFFSSAYIGVYIPLRRLEATLETEADLLETMVSYIQQALADRDITLDRLPDISDQDNVDATPITRAWFQNIFLVTVGKALRSRRLVLLMDDVDVLFGRLSDDWDGISLDAFGFISELLSTHDFLGAVLTLQEDAEENVPQMAPLTDIAHVYRLEDLPPEETALLMRIPTEYHITDGAIEQVQRATDGQPLLAQRVGFALYERIMAIGSGAALTATEQDVREILPSVVDQSHAQFKQQWGALSLNERLVLTAISDEMYRTPLTPVRPQQINRWLVETDYPLDDTAIRAAIRGLEYANVARLEGDGALIASGLLQTWLLKNARLEDERNAHGQVPLRTLLVALVLVAIAVFVALQIDFNRGTPSSPANVSPTVTLEAP